MAESLNVYFSSVFTGDDISILPVLVTKFEGRESDYLGQIIVTPKMIINHLEWMGFLPNYYCKLYNKSACRLRQCSICHENRE